MDAQEVKALSSRFSVSYQTAHIASKRPGASQDSMLVPGLAGRGDEHLRKLRVLYSSMRWLVRCGHERGWGRGSWKQSVLFAGPRERESPH